MAVVVPEQSLLQQARRAFSASLALWLFTVLAAIVTGVFVAQPSATAFVWFISLSGLAVVLLAASVVLEAAADFMRWRREAGD